jgi:hypothetical protein
MRIYYKRFKPLLFTSLKYRKQVHESQLINRHVQSCQYYRLIITNIPSGEKGTHAIQDKTSIPIR